jgi:hypothetical protein
MDIPRAAGYAIVQTLSIHWRAGFAVQAGRRASDSHIPPPIKVSPDARPSNLARAGFMNQARPNPEAIAQHESLKPASSAETTHITAI